MLNAYEVTVLWEGELFSHAAADLAEAVEWARAYPASAKCRVWAPDGFMSRVRG